MQLLTVLDTPSEEQIRSDKSVAPQSVAGNFLFARLGTPAIVLSRGAAQPTDVEKLISPVVVGSARFGEKTGKHVCMCGMWGG